MNRRRRNIRRQLAPGRGRVRIRRSLVLATAGLPLLLIGVMTLFAPRDSEAAPDDWISKPPEVEYPTFDYDGSFTFARLKFDPMDWGAGPFTWGLDLKWNHDYPQAELNFSRILKELTGIEPHLEGGNVLEISDPRLFEHPWAYVCEVGFWDPSEEDVEILRSYLLKGGFLIIDDFIDQWGRRQWFNFERQIRRVLPDHTLIPLTLDHPVFHTFFKMESLDLNDPQMPALDSGIFGIFEDNDPEKRLMVIANYNMDVGDYWEWSDQEFYPVDLTQRGFKLGVNYVIYGLTR